MKRSLGTWSVAVVLVVGLCALPGFADSHARIVRLSNVEGNVQIDRNMGNGYEKAFLNMPLTQGAVLATKADARAEVEFEDGSAVRLIPDSTLEFTELALRDSGARVSRLTLKAGQAYVNYSGTQKEAEFCLLFANESVKLEQPAHFRVDLEEATAQVAVFKGDLKVDGPSGAAELTKNRSAEFDLAANSKFTIAKNVEEDPYDAWDNQQAKYHDEYAKRGSNNNYPYSYGVSDLNYYGNYYNVPGYGMMWQPYFTNAGWDPFMDGAWMYYPGFGYTWVSAYPWGWMPYYYGNWMFVPSYGWMWQPGAYYGGWNPVPRVSNPPKRFAGVNPPTTGTGTVVVGHGPTTSPANPPRRLMVQSGSAGLGVPRGTMNLGKMSQQVQQNGFATMRTPSPPPNRGMSTMSQPGGYSGGVASHGASGGRMSAGPPPVTHSAPPSRSPR